VRERLVEVESALVGLEAGGADLGDLGFHGERLDAVRERPASVSPLPELIDPDPSLHLAQGPPKCGKTTFALAMAQAWGCGVALWDGAPALPGTRALVLSAEQPLTRLEATLRRLDVMHTKVERAAWTQRLVIVARDPELPKAAHQLLTLDEAGLSLLHQGLQHARAEGDPFGLVVLDSLSRLKPRDCEENSNDDMSAWLGRLQELAEEQCTYILLVHHVGHADRNEAHNAGRGASAIAAVAQAAWLLGNVPGQPRQRSLEVRGNAILPAELTFEVASDEMKPGELHYWHPADPLAGYDPCEILNAGEELTQRAFAKRLAGKSDKEEPTGAETRLAKALRLHWKQKGLVDVFEGKGSAIMVRLRS